MMYAMLLSNYKMLPEIHTMEKGFSQIYDSFSYNLILYFIYMSGVILVLKPWSYRQ